MKKKEQKALAQKLAKYELIIQTSDDKKKVRDAQDKIIELSGKVESLDDIAAIDEMVQEILEKYLENQK
jgi:short-subunit dehydrogenase involved in D-alanine esterification of teichoic acids